MSDKIMNQYVEAGCPDGELDQGRAIHWAGNEIERLKAELAANEKAYEVCKEVAIEQQGKICKLTEELSAAREGRTKFFDEE